MVKTAADAFGILLVGINYALHTVLRVWCRQCRQGGGAGGRGWALGVEGGRRVLVVLWFQMLKRKKNKVAGEKSFYTVLCAAINCLRNSFTFSSWSRNSDSET